ncbi:hypothetical protein CAAN3_21S00518 [[Candida] anglica]
MATYISTAQAFASASRLNKLNSSSFSNIRGAIISGEPYMTAGNVLGLLLCYAPAVGVTVGKVSEVVSAVLRDDSVVSEDHMSDGFDLDLDLDLSDEQINSTARDLVADTHKQSLVFGLDTESTEDLAFQFVRAKVQWSSSYVGSFDRFDQLFLLMDGHVAFSQWRKGLFVPYNEWWYHRKVDENVTFAEFEALAPRQQFSLLVGPMNQSNCEMWLARVLMPFLSYQGGSLALLEEWMFQESKQLDRSHKLWSRSILAISRTSPSQQLTPILHRYLVAIYYYSIQKGNLTSTETIKVYDTIKETLTGITLSQDEDTESAAIIDAESPEDLQILTGSEHEVSLDSLIDETGSLFHSDLDPKFATDLSKFLLTPTHASIQLILTILKVSNSLSSTTRLSILDYLQLRWGSRSSQAYKQKEIIRIMSGINTSNWEVVILSVESFRDSFIGKSSYPEVSKLVISRLLSVDLFDPALTLYQRNQSEPPLSPDEFFSCVLNKFWDSFNLATSLQTSSGKLHQATQCIPLFEAIKNISPENSAQIIQIKHLIRAISNMKNFKILVSTSNNRERTPITPNVIIKRFSTAPIDLISTILEQNPKSYLAYEKLYRILNDLLLSFSETSEDIDPSSSPFISLKSACIESALVDGNFSFAYNQSMELFRYLDKPTDTLPWLTFYQVGKYVSPSWFDEESSKASNKIDTLLKQREILSLLLKLGGPSIDNKLIVRQLGSLNLQINNWYRELESNGTNHTQHSDYAPTVKTLASNMVHEATHTTHHASEKISNLLVSGLGWAIGANPE